MNAIREFIKVVDHELHITLPKEFNYKEVEVIIMPRATEEIEFWSDEELSKIGKIGLHSSFWEDDDEDYDKW